MRNYTISFCISNKLLERYHTRFIRGKENKEGCFVWLQLVDIKKKFRQIVMFTIAAFLIGAWFLGLMLSLTFNGMIHLLLVAGIVIVLGKIIHEMTPADHKQKTVGKGKGEMSNEAISGLRISSS